MRTFVCAMTLAALLAAGCGTKKTVVTPGGSATVEEGGGTVKTTISTTEGTAVVEQNEKEGTAKLTATDASGKTTSIETTTKFDLSELGVETYPGAVLSDNPNDSAKVMSEGGQMVTARLRTKDKPEKVEAFYKRLLKNPSSFSTSENATVTGKNAAGDTVMISAQWESKEGKTVISYLVTKKK